MGRNIGHASRSVREDGGDGSAASDINEDLVAILPKLKTEALYLTRSNERADDLLQATCVRVLSRSHQYQPQSRFDRWVSTILHNIWFDELRMLYRRQEQALPDPDQIVDAKFEEAVENQLFLTDIRRTCAQLSDEDFSLLVRIHCYGWTYKDVAEDLNVPIGTVLSRVSRAKAVIRQHR